MYKKKPEYVPKQGEVLFAHHQQFYRFFFENHKKLCDELAGLKMKAVSEVTGPEVTVVYKDNFYAGIQNLQSFIYSYSAFIEDYESEGILSKANELELHFLSDDEYQNLVSKRDGRTPTQEILMTKKYLWYLKKSFMLIDEFVTKLEGSIAVATAERGRNIIYLNYDVFYSLLYEYMQELGRDISSYKYERLQDHYKKLFGFFYTYKYLVPTRLQDIILQGLDIFEKSISSEEAIKLMIALKDGADLTKSKKAHVFRSIKASKDRANEIISLIYTGLSIRNVLPKKKRKTSLDVTLI